VPASSSSESSSVTFVGFRKHLVGGEIATSKEVLENSALGGEMLSGSGAVFVGAGEVRLNFFPFLVLEMGPVGSGYFEGALWKDGKQTSALQPVASGLVFGESGE